MLSQLSFSALFSGLKRAFLQFPLSFLLALGTSIFFSFQLDEIHQNYSSVLSTNEKIVFLGYLGVVLLINAHAWVSSKGLTFKIAVPLLVISLLIFYYFNFGQYENQYYLRYTLFSFASVLLFLISSRNFRHMSDTHLWWISYKRLILILRSAVFSLALMLGIMLALFSLEELFGLKVIDNQYLITWIWSFGFVFPVFLMGGMRSTEDVDAEKATPGILKIFLTFIAFPLLLLYSLILYAYGAKIIITSEWPEGWLATMELVLFALLIIIFLGLYLWLKQSIGSKKRRLIVFSLFYIPLFVLYLFAIKIRISEYGITEPRYLLILIAIWILFIFTYILLNEFKRWRYVVIFPVLLILITSYGPLSLYSISSKSQIKQLIESFNKYELLQNGQFTQNNQEIEFADMKKISGVLDYFFFKNDYSHIQPIFDFDLDSLKEQHYQASKILLNHYGLEYIDAYTNLENYQKETDYHYFLFETAVVPLDSYQYFESINMYSTDMEEYSDHIKIVSDDPFFVVKVNLNNREDSIFFDVRNRISDLIQLNDTNTFNEAISTELGTFRSENENIKMLIVFENLNVRMPENTIDFEYFDAHFFWSYKN